MAAYSDLETQLKLREILLAVPGLPPAQERVWDNSYVIDPATGNPVAHKPTSGVLYLTERFSGGPSFGRTLGKLENRGQYFITVFAPQGTGVKAGRILTDAIKAAFPPKGGWALTSGNTLRIRRDAAPYALDFVELESSPFSYSVVTISCYVLADG